MNIKTKFNIGDYIHFIFKNAKPICDEVTAMKVFIGEINNEDERFTSDMPAIRYYTKNSGSFFIYEQQAFSTAKELKEFLFPNQK